MVRLSIGFRLYGLIALFALALASLGTCAYYYERETLFAEREAQLRTLVQAATGIADRYREAADKGRMSDEAARAAALSDIGAMRYGKGDFLFVQDEQTRMLVHPVSKLVGQYFQDVPDAKGFKFTADVVPRAIRDGGTTVRYFWARPGTDEPIEKLSYYSFYKPWSLVIATGVFIDDIDAVMHEAALRLAVIGAVILIVLSLGAMLVVRSIVRPLRALGDRMRALAGGDTAIAIPETALRDEVGAMAYDLVVLRDGLAEREVLAAQQARDQEGQVRRARHLDALAQAFETEIAGLSGNLAGAAGTMSTIAATMTAVVTQTSAQSVGAASAAEQTSANVQTVAAATEELVATIREIAQQVNRSSQIAREAAGETRRTDAIVKALAAAAERIGGVIGMINAIAGQTNLLALNATIEAARAGEAGRGFAVVAAEVKALASQTTRATEEVAGQIAAIQTETQQAVAAIEAIGRIIGEVDTIATGIAAAMEEQGAATQEIARNVQEASHGTHGVSEALVAVRASTGEAQVASDQVLNGAGGLKQASEALAATVHTFLADVKAA